MQLTANSPLRSALATATCSLLSMDAAFAAVANQDLFSSENPWSVSSAILYYSEKDRVTVVEPVVQLKTAVDDGEFISFKFAYDSISGATPSGATPTNVARILGTTTQTVTAASGGSTTHTTVPLVTPAHALPLVKFSDERFAAAVDLEQPLTRTLRSMFGASLSQEHDYASLGMNASLLWDINNKLTTLTMGASFDADQVTPTGGKHLPFSSVNTAQSTSGSDSKNSYDVLLGITQVVTRRTLMQFNYTRGTSSGYLTDPYKLVSVVDAGGNTTDYLHEKRPDTRVRNALYWKTVYHLTQDVVHFSYRHYWDDWSITSGTADATYRYALARDSYLEPHLRYYTQTAADFFVHSLAEGPLPVFASADLRLGAFHSLTTGMRYGVNFYKDAEYGVGIDYMQQTGDGHPASAIGLQKNENLFPDLKALSVFADLSVKF
jgi:hypothetical protein